MKRIVVAITGASGSIHGFELASAVLRAGHEVHMTLSRSGAAVAGHELERSVDASNPDLAGLLDGPLDRLHYHPPENMFAPIASGSFPTDAMVVVPCSAGTLGRIAAGTSDNLVVRAADVTLKERRRLVLVTRETPLGAIQLRNMLTVTEAGGVILPACPGWYHRPKTVQDLVDFVTARILDQIGVSLEVAPRWGEEEDAS